VLGIVFARLSGGTDRLGRKRWTGLVVGLAGVATLVGPNLTGGAAWPTVEVLLTAVGYGIAPLIAARYLGAVPTVALTSASLALAAVVYAAPAALTWPEPIVVAFGLILAGSALATSKDVVPAPLTAPAARRDRRRSQRGWGAHRAGRPADQRRRAAPMSVGRCTSSSSVYAGSGG
jgi:hypothetical protein